MTTTSKIHYNAMLTTINHCVGTLNQGSFFKPMRKWERKDKSCEFVIHGKSDSDYANNPENRRSISGVFSEG